MSRRPSGSPAAGSLDRAPTLDRTSMAPSEDERAEPSVAVIIPTYNEAESIEACLGAVLDQTYGRITEILVVDGGSTDATTDLVEAHPSVTLLRNPLRAQSAALNIGLRHSRADVVVRVDGHCLIATDYVERCVDVLGSTGAAMVGGAMTPEATGAVHEGIAAAMSSRFGAGPARFHTGGAAGWVDTVYLGAYRRQDALAVGGYAEVLINEDAEFAHRMGSLRGVRFDPSIRSRYSPRSSLRDLGRQFFLYGRGRARTTLRHTESLRPRQLVAPALVIGLASPFRRPVAVLYAAGLTLAVATDGRPLGRQTPAFLAALPTMHLAWGAGFLVGLVRPLPMPAPAAELTTSVVAADG